MNKVVPSKLLKKVESKRLDSIKHYDLNFLGTNGYEHHAPLSFVFEVAQELAQLSNKSDPNDGYYKYYKLFIDAFETNYYAIREGLEEVRKNQEEEDGVIQYGHLGRGSTKGRMARIKKLNSPDDIH